jgi:hypothetical protein
LRVGRFEGEADAVTAGVDDLRKKGDLLIDLEILMLN